MGKILVVAPHPDDETLGCGGTLLRHKDHKDEIHWLIVTKMSEEFGYAKAKIQRRVQEINEVKRLYNFDSLHQLDFAALAIAGSQLLQLVCKIGAVMKQIEPDTVYAPFSGDVHSDHRVIFDAVAACGKWFRYPYVKRILAYEVISETDFDINPQNSTFRPNVFVDISPYLEKKCQIMKVYADEMADFPFPRSEQALRALAHLRAAACGVAAAEAFVLLKEIR